ncbi:SIMPL domain-containing protein [Polaromonas sp.]|uniref:SIMPL domain-containing protein n=1 Tax=Polaromonas sp. TaxID=1869339 RepID=UPI0037500464
MKNTRHILAACLLTLGGTSLWAQAIQPPLQNVAQLSASGSVEVQQDLLSILMSTSRDGTDAAAVQSQLKAALDAALLEAKKTAQPGLMDVRTGNFSLYPRYNKDGKISGWQGRTELVLEGKDFPRITAAAGRIQTLTLGNVGFALSREQRAQVEGQAQAQAIESFKAKALEVSRSFGFSSYTLREVSINANDQGPVRPRMMAMEAKSADSSPIPVEAGKSMVMVNVSGSVQMK